MTACVRARSPKPWPGASPGPAGSAHSRAASQTCSGFCSSCTCGTTPDRTRDQLLLVGLDPQRERDQLGPVVGGALRCRSMRACSRAAKRVGPGGGGPAAAPPRRPGAPGGPPPTASPVPGAAAAGGAARHRVGDGVEHVVHQRLGRAGVEAVVRPGAGQHRDPVVVGGVEVGDPPGRWPTSSGANLPAATSRMPSSTAPESSPTLGCRSSRACARVSTGSAARIGSATVRRSSLNSTTLSRGGSPGRKVAGPVTGTKLKRMPSGVGSVDDPTVPTGTDRSAGAGRGCGASA